MQSNFCACPKQPYAAELIKRAQTNMHHSIMYRQGWNNRSSRVDNTGIVDTGSTNAVQHLLYCRASLKSTRFIVRTMKVAMHKEP